MAGINIGITSTLPELAAHFLRVSRRITDELDKATAQTAREGNRAGVRFATRSAGEHGKHYPRAFSVERRGIADFIYGPEAGLPQGGMSFEEGSRNQPPHRDLAKSADIVRAKFPGRIDRAIGKALGG